MIKIANYEEVFTHSKKTDCPVAYCELKATGCSDPLASQTNVVLGSSPFHVTAKTSNTDGYSVEFCYSCLVDSGDASPIKFDKDSLTIRAYADCTNHLALQTSFSPPAVVYASGGSGTVIAETYETIF